MAQDDGQARRRRLEERLGGRDALEVLAGTPEILAEIAHEYTDDELRAAPADGGWSSAEIFGHLVDVELVMAVRARSLLAESDPIIESFDRDAWVREQAYGTRDPDDTYEDFRKLREMNLRFWRGLPEGATAKRGRMEGSGDEITLEGLQGLWAGHDLVHLDQLEQRLRHESS